LPSEIRLNVQCALVAVPCLCRPAHGFEHDAEIEVGVEVRGRYLDSAPVSRLCPQKVALGLEYVAEVVVGVHEVRLVLDRGLKQRHGRGRIAGLEAGDGAEIQHPRIVRMRFQQ
jgi:hypothetical protein